MKSKENKKFSTYISCFFFWMGLLGFCILAIDVSQGKKIGMDSDVYQLISKRFMTNFFTNLMKCVTWFGEILWFFFLSIFLFFKIQNKKIGYRILGNLGLITFINLILKSFFHRLRPTELQLVSIHGYSFPSGHAMISLAFYGYLIYLISYFETPKKLKWFSMFFLSSLIFLIGISRIYLGIHYVSDVVAGFFFAISYLIVFVKKEKEILERKEKCEK